CSYTANIYRANDDQGQQFSIHNNLLPRIHFDKNHPYFNHHLQDHRFQRKILPSLRNGVHVPQVGARATDSSEYFSWANKNGRPLEYLRGKRGNLNKFWLFAKKDSSYEDHAAFQNTLANGFWRSGIVGR
ncbi:unnamed protein product, partial [Didymodactylos carnosus]